MNHLITRKENPVSKVALGAVYIVRTQPGEEGDQAIVINCITVQGEGGSKKAKNLCTYYVAPWLMRNYASSAIGRADLNRCRTLIVRVVEVERPKWIAPRGSPSKPTRSSATNI